MKFVVAAGGSGSRLSPITRFTNKHLIPCEPHKLMIDYPLDFMIGQGASEVTIVTGSNHASQIVDYVGDGDKYGYRRVEYAFQARPAGIADILKRISIKDEGVCLILGDNYFSAQQVKIQTFSRAAAFQYDVVDMDLAKSFGQVFFRDGIPTYIVEKPENPQHSKILTGLYYFPPDVLEKVNRLSPSMRNELEITDLLEIYLKEGRLDVHDVSGEWCDLGEWSSLQKFWKSR